MSRPCRERYWHHAQHQSTKPASADSAPHVTLSYWRFPWTAFAGSWWCHFIQQENKVSTFTVAVPGSMTGATSGHCSQNQIMWPLRLRLGKCESNVNSGRLWYFLVCQKHIEQIILVQPTWWRREQTGSDKVWKPLTKDLPILGVLCD